MLCEHPARAECNNPMEPLRCDPVNSSKGNRITACAGCWWSAAQRHWFPPVTVQAAPLPAAQVIGSNSPNRDQAHATRAAWMDPGRSRLTTAPQQHEHSPRTQSSHTCSHPADERHRALCARHRVHRLILCSKWLPHMVRSVLILSEREEHWGVWVPVQHDGAA